jgi:RNA polymerase sigma-70 factor (ECF subfamily)
MGEFDAFFNAHATPIWNYLRRLTGDPDRAADLFQRVFLKAWTHFATRSTGSDRAWIFTIAVNEARDDMRRRGRDRVRCMSAEDLGRAAAPPEATPEDRELVRRILGALADLPASQRELFLLVRYHGFTFSEAAALVGMGLSAAKMSVARAHERLTRMLADKLHLGSIL